MVCIVLKKPRYHCSKIWAGTTNTLVANVLGLSLCSGRCSGLWQLHNLHQWHKHMLSCQCLYVCERRILAQVEQIDERIKYFKAYQNHSSEAWTYQRCCRAVVDQIRINIILVYIIQHASSLPADSHSPSSQSSQRKQSHAHETNVPKLPKHTICNRFDTSAFD